MPASLRSDYPINCPGSNGHFQSGTVAHFHRNMQDFISTHVRLCALSIFTQHRLSFAGAFWEDAVASWLTLPFSHKRPLPNDGEPPAHSSSQLSSMNDVPSGLAGRYNMFVSL